MPNDADLAVMTAIARRAADTVREPMTPEQRTSVVFRIVQRLIDAGAWVRGETVYLPKED